MPGSSSLCSHTAQVPITDPNPIQLRKLQRWLISTWLHRNDYSKLGYRVDSCGTSFAHLSCSGGHEKYTRLHCKQDYCPTCGQKWSAAHKRRAVRAMDRLVWGNVVGYMVYTLPEEVTSRHPDRDALSYLSKKAWEITKRHFDTEGGMTRTHLQGENSEKLHIHINVLFPLRKDNDIGKVPLEVLKAIRQEWANVINGYFELGDKKQNCYYTFVWQLGKRIHKVKYVMRPIVTTSNFLSLSAEDKHYVLSLRGWHNTRWFGKLANSQYKKYLDAQGISHSNHTDKDVGLSRRCPICKEKFKYVDMVSEDALPRSRLRWYDNDTLVDFPLYSLVKNDTS